MRPKYTILIDTDYLASVNSADRAWLEKWLHSAGPRAFPNICTIDCKSPTAAARVMSTLTGRGLPRGSFVVQGAA